MLTKDSPEVTRFLTAWHENGRARFERDYDALVYDDYAPKVAKQRKRFIALDRKDSGVFLVDRATHTLYSIKAYGVPNRALGQIEDVTRAYEQTTTDLGAPGYVDTDSRLARLANAQ
jgi:hypothetical protein